MSARDLAQSLEAARQARRAAELNGDAVRVVAAQREVDQLRKALFAMDEEQRSKELFAPDVPLACLPVRIETAFIKDQALRLRVYPDTIHIGGHDPRLTATEVALAEDVAARATTEDPAALHAWMDTLVGAGRGAYIRAEVAAGRAVTRADDDDDLPARASALPDLWQVTLAWGNTSVTVPFPAMVADPLTLGPSVEDVSGLFAPDALARLWAGRRSINTGLAWMIDFHTALEVGMAAEIDLNAPEFAALAQHLAGGGAVDTLSITGLRWAGPDEGAQTIAELLDGHTILRDAQIAPQGSATSNDGEHRTAGQAVQRDGPNVDRLRKAFGLSQKELLLCGDVAQDEDLVAQLTTSALWPGTGGLYAEASLGLAVDDVEPVRVFYRDSLRARGALPVLRIGSEPYGMLPMMLADDAAPVPDTAFEQALTERVNTARDAMNGSPVSTDRPEDYESWLTLFGTEAHPGTLLGLPFGRWGRSNSLQALQMLDRLNLPAAKDTLADITAIDRLIEVAPRLPLSRYAADAIDRTDRVASEVLRVRSLAELFAILPQDRWPVQPWFEMPLVRRLSFAAGLWRVEQDGAEPGDPVTFTLLRHAVFCHFASLMRAGIVAAGQVPLALVDTQGDRRVMPLLEQFRDVTGLSEEQLTLPLDPDVARQLRLPRALAEQNAELAKALPFLAELDASDPDALELAIREHMALVSYRPDAWASALDAARLDRMRERQPTGLLIGGYGRVCGLKPGIKNTGSEAIIARSLDKAMTAAALRTGMKNRQANGGSAEALAVKLSSARVGPAQEVLGAMRAGRGLGAVLGQRIETGLRRELATQPDKLNDVIEALRQDFPLREGLRDGANDAAKGADTCDGVKLLEAFETDAPIIPAQARPMVEAARDITEAIADLGLAEAVHGIISAGPDRAGAALDAFSRGESIPDVFEVVQERRSGAGLALTISVLGKARPVPATPQLDLAGVSGARAIAAGPLAGVVEDWLGPLSGYGFWTLSEDDQPRWIGLDTLGLDPVAVVFSALAQRDGQTDVPLIDIAKPGPQDEPSLAQTRALFDRLRRMLAQARPMGTDEPQGGFEADTDDAGQRRAHVTGLAEFVLGALRDGASDALSMAEAFGRADARIALDDDDERAAHAARVADRLENDLKAFADGAGYEVLFGNEMPTAPVLVPAAQRNLAGRIAEAAGYRDKHGIMPLTHWLRDVASTRPRVAAMLQAAEACEALRDETVMTLHPHQDAAAPDWAGIKAISGTEVSQAGLIIGEAAVPEGGIVIDGWSEVLPDVHADAAVAIEAQGPSARAPQAVLLVMSDGPFTAKAPVQALDRLFALMAERALGPQDMGGMLRLPPVMSFQEPKP